MLLDTAVACRALSSIEQNNAVIQDCPYCPQLQVIPAGHFKLTNDKDVEIAKPLAVGRYEITREQYARFVTATQRRDPDKCFVFQGVDNGGQARFGWTSGLNWRNPGYKQSDSEPAVCISYNDAVAYAQWLSSVTHQSYRLPSEAEFEYATRAGTQTPYFWGNDASKVCEHANSADSALVRAYPTFNEAVTACDDGYAYTAPVGSYRPNAFGLYDMIGNVWEWTADCQHDDADKLPRDATPYVSNECAQHIRRGASWYRLSSTQRSALPNADWHGNAGLRVVRLLK